MEEITRHEEFCDHQAEVGRLEQRIKELEKQYNYIVGGATRARQTICDLESERDSLEYTVMELRKNAEESDRRIDTLEKKLSIIRQTCNL